MTSFFERIAHAWAVLMGRTIVVTQVFTTDAEAELLQLHARVMFSLRYLKDIPMALADDITALGVTIQNALAAKDAAVAPLNQQIADLANQVQVLTAEVAAADAQVVALTASLNPHVPAA